MESDSHPSVEFRREHLQYDRDNDCFRCPNGKELTLTTVARLGVGDVTHLCVGDMQQFGKLSPVGGRLVEQQQKFGVCQHEPGRLGFQTFLNVLRGRIEARIRARRL